MATPNTASTSYHSILTYMVQTGGTKVAKALAKKRIDEFKPLGKDPAERKVDAFLKQNKQHILNSRVGRTNEWLYFPADSSPTDFDKWDLNATVFILLETCKLGNEVRMYIKQVQQFQNELVRLSSTNIEETEFENYKTKVTEMLNNILTEIGDEHLAKDIDNMNQQISDGSIFQNTKQQTIHEENRNVLPKSKYSGDDMTGHIPKLHDKEFPNWIKAHLALDITKEGIEDAVLNEIVTFHKDILNKILSPEQIRNNDLCSQCKNENILLCPTRGICIVKNGQCSFHSCQQKQYRPCPKLICDGLREKIKQCHNYNCPSWKNTKAEDWCQNPWELAKCYLPPDGYLGVSSIAETDINGIVSVIMNHATFKNKADMRHCDQVRKVTREVRHSPDLCINDQILNNIVDTLDHFLNVSRLFQGDLKAAASVQKLTELKKNSLTITADYVTNTYLDAITERSLQVAKEHKHETKADLNKLEKVATQNTKGIFTAKAQNAVALGIKDVKRLKAAFRQRLIQHYIEESLLPKANDTLQNLKGKLIIKLFPNFTPAYERGSHENRASKLHLTVLSFIESMYLNPSSSKRLFFVSGKHDAIDEAYVDILSAWVDSVLNDDNDVDSTEYDVALVFQRRKNSKHYKDIQSYVYNNLAEELGCSREEIMHVLSCCKRCLVLLNESSSMFSHILPVESPYHVIFFTTEGVQQLSTSYSVNKFAASNDRNVAIVLKNNAVLTGTDVYELEQWINGRLATSERSKHTVCFVDMRTDTDTDACIHLTPAAQTEVIELHNCDISFSVSH